MKRVFFDIFLIASLFLLPWWVGFFIAIIGIFIFSNFYEFIFFGIFVYVTYGFESERIIASRFYLPTISLLIFFLISKSKRFMVFYK